MGTLWFKSYSTSGLNFQMEANFIESLPSVYLRTFTLEDGKNQTWLCSVPLEYLLPTVTRPET